MLSIARQTASDFGGGGGGDSNPLLRIRFLFTSPQVSELHRYQPEKNYCSGKDDKEKIRGVNLQAET